MKYFPLAPLLIICAILCNCSTSVELPEGSSKGYRSARLVKAGAGAPASSELEDSVAVNRSVQAAITAEFERNGLSMGSANADLVVAHMLVRQDNAMTTMNSDYFGYGRDAMAIMDEAHKRGVLKSTRPDAFEAGAIVIDILDAKTNKLIFRNLAKRDLLQNADPATRRNRIHQAVAEALAPFFKG
jgi:hypothetical protein